MYYYYTMVNVNDFIVKPVPKRSEDIILQVKSEDLREEKRIDRKAVLERLQQLMKGLSVEPIKNILQGDEEEGKESPDDMYKDTDDDTKKDKRLTKKQTSIQENIRSITFSDDDKDGEKTKKSRQQKIYQKSKSIVMSPSLKKLLKENDEKKASYTCDNYESLIQQQVVTDYLSLNTHARGLLLFHGMGSGKTCTAIVATEGLKTEKKIQILTPESLKTNFFNEIKKCGDENFRRDQRWTKKKIRERREADELAKVVSIDVDAILENGIWLSAEDDKGTPFADLSGDDQAEVDKQIDKMIRAKYKSVAYNKLTEEQMKKMTENDTKNPFDNSVVIVDEVHNLVKQIVKDKDPISVRLYHYLMGAQSAKLVFLSGTPIIESPYEIAVIFNMLHGYIRKWTVPLNADKKPKLSGVEYKDNKAIITHDLNTDPDFSLKEVLNSLNADRDPTLENFKILPDEESSFNSKFIEKDEMTNREAFQRRILGLTSFFKGAPDELFPRFDKNRDMIIVRVPMSDYQKEQTEKTQEEAKRREISNFVAPDESDAPLLKDALQTFSPKCLHMLENIEDDDNKGLHMVYSELSTKTIREILLANNFKEFRLKKGAANMFEIEEGEDENETKPRFVLFSEIKDEEERDTILNIYNHNWEELNPVLQEKLERMEKTNKEIIKVFMISPRDAEGIGLKNTRFVHILEPSENMSRIEQVIGRVRRVCSHIDLDEEMRTVKVYLYMSEGDDTIDEKIYREANERDHLIQEVLRAVKETAIDCAVYEKNAVCYKLEKTKTKANTIIGGKRYKRDKDNNIYDVDSEKPFGKLMRGENDYWSIQ